MLFCQKSIHNNIFFSAFCPNECQTVYCSSDKCSLLFVCLIWLLKDEKIPATYKQKKHVQTSVLQMLMLILPCFISNNNIFFRFSVFFSRSEFADLSTLFKRLDSLNYSTVYYMFDGNNIRDFGNCDMAHQLSIAYQKTVLFWPCPQMKVSHILHEKECYIFC